MSNSEFTAIPVRPCIKCGSTERYKNGKCAPCSKGSASEWYAANARKANATSAAWKAANADREKASKAAWHAANTDKVKASNAARYASDPRKSIDSALAWRAANPERANATTSAWRALNIDKIKAASAAWRDANKDKRKAYKAAWCEANPEMCKIHKQTRRARKVESSGVLSKGLESKLFKMQNGKCPCCNKPLGDNYHLDHKMPLALGGSNTDDNMQLLRPICNLQKHAKHPIDFMQSRGFLL